MTKFELINGHLCRMVEPEPLTDKSQFPCVVRLIQDDSPMGLCNRWKYGEKQDFLKKNWTISSLENNLNKVKDIHYSQFEIIGYPVVDGSAEWALHQMMQGKWVYNPSLEKHKSDKLDTRYLHAYGIFGQDIVVKNTLTGIDSILSAANISHWTNYVEPFGWQLYTEPKPLLADAKVGDLCKHRNGVWSQIIDTNGTYIPGQPVRTTLKDSKGINRNFCLSGCHFTMQFGGEYDIIHTEPLAPEGTSEWAWQMLMLGKTVYNPSRYYSSSHGCITSDMLGNGSKQSFVDGQEPSGWQLYEEKPETAKEQFAVGDWVEVDYKGTLYHRQVVSVHDNGIRVKFVGATPLLSFDGKNNMVSMRLVRKPSPSEVVVDFGRFKGRVKKYHGDKVRVYDENDINFACVAIAFLDPATRSIVESLLKAQEEK